MNPHDDNEANLIDQFKPPQGLNDRMGVGSGRLFSQQAKRTAARRAFNFPKVVVIDDFNGILTVWAVDFHK